MLVGRMSHKRSRSSDDVLFISALAVVLAGLGLLLRTTGVASSMFYLWPLILSAAGGCIVYLAVVRNMGSAPFFFGAFLAGLGVFLLARGLAGWPLRAAWPLVMPVIGLALAATGYRDKGRAKASYLIPALGFAGLGFLFSLFSFDIIGISLGRFIRIWWPLLVIAGGGALFAAYGYSRRRSGRPPSP